MRGKSDFLPQQRLWTPWRMAYVGGTPAKAECVFCQALMADDDAASYVVHRGEHCFVIMNLYPYNTGHLMIVPNAHTSELTALSQSTRAEMAELTASFSAGLRDVLGCDGLNAGMNLGSAAGAGITDHLHQHLVPRWIGDANFMPLVGATKVLPELIAATYAKVRAEIARLQASSPAVRLVLLSPDRMHWFSTGDSVPEVVLEPDEPAWRQAARWLASRAESFELLGWAGLASTRADTSEPPALAYTITPGPDTDLTICHVMDDDEAGSGGAVPDTIRRARNRFPASGMAHAL